MPQSPIPSSIAVGPAKQGVLLAADANGALTVTDGGLKSVLDVTAAAVIKASPGRLAKIMIVAPGTGGVLTINDCASVGAAATANEILTIAFGSLTVGQVIEFDWPCAVGIVVSAVPSGGSQISVSYT